MTNDDSSDKPNQKPSGRGGNYVDPPAQHRFKPGQSGNPRGRPKGSISLTNALVKLLRKKSKVTIGGEIKALSQSEIIAFQVIQHASKGDLQFIKFVTQQTQNHPEMQLQATTEDAEKEVLIDKVIGLMKVLIDSQTQDIEPNPITLPEDEIKSIVPSETGVVGTKASSPVPSPRTAGAEVPVIYKPAPKPQLTEDELRKKQWELEVLNGIAKSGNAEELLRKYRVEEKAKKPRE